MFFSAGSVGVNVLLHIVVGVENDLDNAVLVHPLDKILAQTGILLTGSAQQGESVILFSLRVQAALGQASTHSPQPMQRRASRWGRKFTGVRASTDFFLQAFTQAPQLTQRSGSN